MGAWYVWTVVIIIFGGTALTIAVWALIAPVLLIVACCCPKWLGSPRYTFNPKVTTQRLDQALGFRAFEPMGCDASRSTCAICIEEFQEGCKVRVLPCGHTFHAECIDIWFIEKQPSLTCPMCKGEVDFPALFAASLTTVASTSQSRVAHTELWGPLPEEPSRAERIRCWRQGERDGPGIAPRPSSHRIATGHGGSGGSTRAISGEVASTRVQQQVHRLEGPLSYRICELDEIVNMNNNNIIINQNSNSNSFSGKPPGGGRHHPRAPLVEGEDEVEWLDTALSRRDGAVRTGEKKYDEEGEMAEEDVEEAGGEGRTPRETRAHARASRVNDRWEIFV